MTRGFAFCAVSLERSPGPDVPASQTVSLADTVDEASISSVYHFDELTIPKRNASTDWFYGDIREVLAVSQYLSDSLQKYCLNRVGGLYMALVTDPACSDSVWPYPQGFPNYYSSFELALQLLASYGVTGDVTVQSMTVYGLEIQTSLISPPLSVEESALAPPAVRFCTPLPLSSQNGITTGLDFAEYIREAGMECVSNRRSFGTAQNKRAGLRLSRKKVR